MARMGIEGLGYKMNACKFSAKIRLLDETDMEIIGIAK